MVVLRKSAELSVEKYVLAEAEEDAVIHPGEIAIRYLSINDSDRQIRSQWLATVVSEMQVYSYVENDTSFLSTYGKNYQALVVGGKDVVRMARVMKHNFPMLKNRMKICLVSKSTARGRAQLIAAGYDDAIDIEKIDPREGLMRFRAIWRRYAEWFERQQEERRQSSKLDELAVAQALSDREKRLLACLELSRGTPVSHATLRSLISSDWEAVSQEHLKVVICNLRRKLNPGVQIVAVRGEGYLIELKPETAPAL